MDSRLRFCHAVKGLEAYSIKMKRQLIDQYILAWIKFGGKMKREKNTQLILQQIRHRMKEEQIDAWIVLSNDFHESEYVGDYFKCREYVSGFTGSAGSLVIFENSAALSTDGRYFLQAEKELESTGIMLLKKREENVPELEEFIAQNLAEGTSVGVDGRTISVSEYRRLHRVLEKKKIRIQLKYDLVGDIWKDRPKMSCTLAWELNISYAGRSRAEKLSEIRKKIQEEGADCTVISSLDDIAWALNIRGNDIACTPLILGFLVVTKTSALWFVQKQAVSRELAQRLYQDGIFICNYEEIYSYLEKIEENILFLDPNRTNMLLYQCAQGTKQNEKRKIIEGRNVTQLPKAVKNPIEIENMKKAHKKDAVACIKFIYWLKTQANKNAKSNKLNKCLSHENLILLEGEKNGKRERKQLTEIIAAERLEEYRREQDHYLGPSFHTIVGYAQHGAIVHYSATPETDLPFKAENMALIDSGGHYMEGTTDITRTIALGSLTQEQKHAYTLVLRGNINLAAAKFKYGCAGIHLDCLARKALWQEGLDYNHGTGHGVGCLLSVHEPPNCFRNAMSESREECVKLEPGMITSNEPGIYIEGKFGIRLENLILCKELEKNQYGRFLGFETLTLVPFDRDAILVEELEAWERDWLNRYHTEIVDQVGCLLDEKELVWLKEATAPI